jgi:hypothetical protein
MRSESYGCSNCGEPANELLSEHIGYLGESAGEWYCNVEPFGGEILGTIPAIAAGPGGAAAAPAAPVATARPIPANLNLSPPGSPSSGNLPAPFNF